MVRLYAKETAVELTKIFDDIKNARNEGDNNNTGIDNDFAAQAEEKLDDIFQD